MLDDLPELPRGVGAGPTGAGGEGPAACTERLQLLLNPETSVQKRHSYTRKRLRTVVWIEVVGTQHGSRTAHYEISH